MIDSRIFRAYDIRGKAYEQLTAEACNLIGRGFGSHLVEATGKPHPTVCVGRDARLHSEEFEKELIAGLISTGCIAVSIGQTPSPVNYFTICHTHLDGGMQITASHNPAEDNGIKLSVAHAEAFAGEDLQKLRVRIEEKKFVEGEGRVEMYDALKPYLERMKKMFGDIAEGIRIVVDSGNGVAGPLYCQVLRNAGADVTELYTEPDGRFPNHAADPSKQDTLADLQTLVKKQRSDLGLAFDGDGDRVGLVDENGDIRTADEILLMLAQDHLSRFPGNPVVFTVSNSGVLESEIEAWGGRPVMCKVGHSFVEHTMREHDALLGGEQSGHFFCGEDYYAFDDALVASLRLLSIVQRSGKSISQLCKSFPRVYQSPEKRPHVPDDQKNRIIEEVTLHFVKDHQVITLDGARVDFGDGSWAGIRASNTAPRISICIEARSQDRLDEIEHLIMDHLKEYPEIGWDKD